MKCAIVHLHSTKAFTKKIQFSSRNKAWYSLQKSTEWTVQFFWGRYQGFHEKGSLGNFLYEISCMKGRCTGGGRGEAMVISGPYPSSHSTSVPHSAPPENLLVRTNDWYIGILWGIKSKGDMSDITGQGILE